MGWLFVSFSLPQWGGWLEEYKELSNLLIFATNPKNWAILMRYSIILRCYHKLLKSFVTSLTSMCTWMPFPKGYSSVPFSPLQVLIWQCKWERGVDCPASCKFTLIVCYADIGPAHWNFNHSLWLVESFSAGVEDGVWCVVCRMGGGI